MESEVNRNEDNIISIYYDYLDNLLSTIRSSIENCNINIDNHKQLYFSCFFCRMVDLSFSCQSLVCSRNYSAVPIIIRSIFELRVDLELLSREENYFLALDAAWQEQRKRLLGNVRSSKEGESLYEVKEITDVSRLLESCSDELKALVDSGWNRDLLK